MNKYITSLESTYKTTSKQVLVKFKSCTRISKMQASKNLLMPFKSHFYVIPEK